MNAPVTSLAQKLNPDGLSAEFTCKGTVARQRRERFCQLLVQYRSEGLASSENIVAKDIRLRAYREAGLGKGGGAAGTSDEHNARRLANQPDVKARCAEIMLQEAEHIGASAGAIILEMCKLAYANMGDVLKVGDDGKLVPILDWDRPITRDFAAAISEVGFDTKGRPKIKLHDKAGVLRDLAKIFELFKDGGDTNVQVNNIGLGERLDAAVRRLSAA
jgi:hypothetical protein